MNKKISIIIPTFNRYDMLQDAVKSILKQTYRNFEIIIIDDNSNDNTPMIKEKYIELVYIRNNKNRGAGYNRKLGLQKAKGDFIIFMDDDDYYTDKFFFEKAIEIFEKHQDVIFVIANSKILYVDTQIFENNYLNVKGKFDSIEYLSGFLIKYKKPLSTFTCIFRKEILEKSNFASMKMVNDVVIYLRSLTSGQSIYGMKDLIGVYRVHSQNISNKITYKFLLENMNEKLHVYQYIKDNQLFNSHEIWWKGQIEATIGYWVYGSRPSLKKLLKMKHWCWKKCEDKEFVSKIFRRYKDYLIDYKKCTIKRKIKKVLANKGKYNER